MKVRQERHQESLSDISAEVRGEMHGDEPAHPGMVVTLCSAAPRNQRSWKYFEIAILVERIRSLCKAQFPQRGELEDAASQAERRPPLSCRENISERVGLKMCRWSGARKLQAFPPFLPVPPDQPDSQMSAGAGMQWE